jgi:hypothetical protein
VWQIEALPKLTKRGAVSIPTTAKEMGLLYSFPFHVVNILPSDRQTFHLLILSTRLVNSNKKQLTKPTDHKEYLPGIRGARPRKNSFVMHNTRAPNQIAAQHILPPPPRQVAILKSGEKSANWPQNTVIYRKQPRALWSCVL